MNEIKETLVRRLSSVVILPAVYLLQFFFAGTGLLVGCLNLVHGNFTGIFFLGPGLLLCIIAVVLTKLIWYRTFFDKSLVGIDALAMVQWDENHIRFSGTFFDFTVLPCDVLSYKLIGFLEIELFMLKLVVRTGDTTQTLLLSVTMPGKTEFLEFIKTRATALNG